MIADLYLLNSSFTYRKGGTLDDLGMEIEELHITIQHIKEQRDCHIDEDRVFKYEGTYDLMIYQSYTISEFLYVPNIVSPDIKKALGFIIDRSAKDCRLSEAEVINLISKNDSSNLNGLLCLYSIHNPGEIDTTQFIKTKKDWYKFHRSFLAKYPIDEENFYNEIKKYFSKIFFHSDVEIALRGLNGGLKRFAKTIIHNLTQLNDCFINSNPSNRNETLNLFSTRCHVVATLEGDASRKHVFTRDFMDKNSNSVVPICCEPHLKLDKSDSSGDTHDYYNRIYFHEGRPNIEGNRILVAYIGKHP